MTDYRSYLKGELTKRMLANNAYSLRAFSRDIGVAPSTISQILSGKRKLSVERALRIADKLELEFDEQEYFSLLVQLDNCSDADTRVAILEKIEKLQQRRQISNIELEKFRLISDWYHIPIMALTDIPNFDFSPKNIASYLGIKLVEAENAIERLLRLELLTKREDGSFARSQQNPVFDAEVTNLALRKFHKQMLERAIDSLDTQSLDEKFIGSETLAISQEDLPRAKALINDFLNKLIRSLGQTPKKDSVYHLGCQFFRVNKKGE